MFPDTYYPLEIAIFWQAVEGQPDHVALGYLRALTFYWGHLHCEGLRNNKEYLRKLCRIERDQWEEASEIIFDNDKFFTLRNDMWHQKRALEEWQAKCAAYDAQRKRTRAATIARLQKQRNQKRHQ